MSTRKKKERRKVNKEARITVGRPSKSLELMMDTSEIDVIRVELSAVFDQCLKEDRGWTEEQIKEYKASQEAREQERINDPDYCPCCGRSCWE